MLKSAVIVMTVLGCSDDASQCELIEQPQIQWESTQACEAATTDALRRHDDANYPVVVAHCTNKQALDTAIPANPKPAGENIEVANGEDPDNLFDQAGVPLETIETAKQDKRVLVRLRDGVVSVRKGANNVLTKFVDNTRNGLSTLAKRFRAIVAPMEKEAQ